MKLEKHIIDRKLDIMKEEGIELPIKQDVDVYVAPLGDAAKVPCFELTQSLRRAGYICETDYLSKSIKAQMKAADKAGARYCIIIGDDELAQGVASVRNMQESTQENVALNEVLDYIK